MLDHPLCEAVYDRIAVEVLKVVNFYRYTYRNTRLDGVYLTGGGASVAPLRRAVTGRLELPALPLEDLVPVEGGAELLPSCACAAAEYAPSPSESASSRNSDRSLFGIDIVIHRRVRAHAPCRSFLGWISHRRVWAPQR